MDPVGVYVKSESNLDLTDSLNDFVYLFAPFNVWLVKPDFAGNRAHSDCNFPLTTLLALTFFG